MQLSLDNVRLQDLTKYVELQAQKASQFNNSEIINVLEDYYQGDQPVLLTDRQKEFIRPLINWSEKFTFCHNVASIVVDTLEEHINIDDVFVSEEDDEQLNALLGSILERNDFDLLQQELHREFLKLKHAFIMVDLDDEGIPRLKVHKPFNGTVGLLKTCLPDDTTVIAYQNFFYDLVDGKQVYRRTVYYEDRIEKFVREGSGYWVRFGDEPIIEWDLGWFIVEFSNGYSEVEKVIPFQNALNKTWLDIIASADASGFPIPIIEYNDEKIDFGKDDENITGADELLFSPDRAFEVWNAKVSRLEPSNMQPLLDVLWAQTVAISSITKVPQYLLRPMGMGSNISGNSLKQANEPLIKKVESKQKLLSKPWIQVFEICQRLYNWSNNLSVEPTKVKLVWAEIKVEDQTDSRAQARFENELGLPLSVSMRTLGYDSQDVENILNEMRLDRAQTIRTIAGQLQNGETNNTLSGQGNSNSLQSA